MNDFNLNLTNQSQNCNRLKRTPRKTVINRTIQIEKHFILKRNEKGEESKIWFDMRKSTLFISRKWAVVEYKISQVWIAFYFTFCNRKVGLYSLPNINHAMFSKFDLCSTKDCLKMFSKSNSSGVNLVCFVIFDEVTMKLIFNIHVRQLLILQLCILRNLKYHLINFQTEL